jgi:hypothetical protein
MAERNGFAYQKVEIVAPSTVIVDRHAQAVFAMNRCIREGGDPLFL